MVRVSYQYFVPGFIDRYCVWLQVNFLLMAFVIAGICVDNLIAAWIYLRDCCFLRSSFKRFIFMNILEHFIINLLHASSVNLHCTTI